MSMNYIQFIQYNVDIQTRVNQFYLILQYLQYWYNQYFPESSSIGNTDITSIFQNLPVSAILVLPVFSRICQYLQYWYYQYFPESSGIYNTHILAMTSIADTGKFWKILGYQYLPVSVPVLQILEDTGKIPVLPVLCTSIVVPVSRPLLHIIRLVSNSLLCMNVLLILFDAIIYLF